eukprot:6028097-Prymnesium_polylepis.1
MARHASDRGARSPHVGRCRVRGGDTCRRAAPLSNPRPAQSAPPDHLAHRAHGRTRTAAAHPAAAAPSFA